MPEHSIADQALDIRVTGLPAAKRVVIGLRSRDDKGFLWTSQAVFSADRVGRVDLGRARSLSGTYRGVWPMGLIASMHPVKPPADRVYLWGRGTRDFELTVNANQQVIASTTFRRSWGRPLVVRPETVQSAGFVGTFFAPRGLVRRTALVTLGGAEGGNSTTLLASRLAADGYPTLALAYFHAPGLPQTLTDIPLEYFRRALAWLAQQPQVDPHRIIIDGASRGTEVALLIAIHYSALVHGVIAVSLSNVVACGTRGLTGPRGCIGPSFTLGGKPLPYTRQWNDPYPTDTAAAIIPVEQIKSPLLLACAEDDSVSNSCGSAHAIMRRLAAKHSTTRRSMYAYRNGGHLIDHQLPYEPGMTTFDYDLPQGEQTREQLWPHILTFLRNL